MDDVSYNHRVSSTLVRLHGVTVYVRDQDRSLQFYLGQLGFNLITNAPLSDGTRLITVGPSEGPPTLALIAPPPESEHYKLIGRNTGAIFLAENVHAKVSEWESKGVVFRQFPGVPSWDGRFVAFEDPDGNSFGLVGFDAATRRFEAERRAATEKREAEQRAAQELEIARSVQARLFPQSKPRAGNIDYAGICIQARQVGGDYYDFLALGDNRLGLVIGDIAGKGIGGALLMANLQANLRSQCANLNEPITGLSAVNQLFFDNTGDHAYATLFFGEYRGRSNRFRYANCGHLPGLLLRPDGVVERLGSTSTVLGLFRQWDCVIEEAPFLPGDLLLLYTDGLSEASNEAGDEFGEERIIQALRRHQPLGSEAFLGALLDEVRAFAPLEQQDDITLIVAKL